MLGNFWTTPKDGNWLLRDPTMRLEVRTYSTTPWSPGKGRGTGGWINCQWLNKLCLCNEAPIKFQKDWVWRASMLLNSVDLGESWLIGKDSDVWRDLGQEEKWMTEDEMAGWHHQLIGLEFEGTLGVGDGQGSLVCCDSWGGKESDMTERLNWTELCSPRTMEAWWLFPYLPFCISFIWMFLYIGNCTQYSVMAYIGKRI